MSSGVPEADASAVSSTTIAVIGNPNVGKTSVFNRLTNLFARTGNFSGTTVERRIGTLCVEDQDIRLVDLPGLYSLDAQSPDEQIAKSFLEGGDLGDQPPNGILVIVDATNLERSLFVVGQVLERRIPTVVAVNMIELATQQGLRIDCDRLASELGCRVVPVSARTGEGFADLRAAIVQLTRPEGLTVLAEAPCESCQACPYAHGHQWASSLARSATSTNNQRWRQMMDRVDLVLTHPFAGMLAFAAIMLCVFALVFWLAAYPMDLLDHLVASLAALVASWLPAGAVQSLITDGIIGGVGSVLVFLPQILILFLALALLEDSGYLARAVTVVDRWMRRVGLPGQAFIPLLAAHACAIPAIMATKVIGNRRDRLAAILVIPLMTCSARLPVYAIVAAMLFPGNAFHASLLFAGAYALGMVAAFAMAWLLRVTILPGSATPLILDLPAYRMPSLKNSLRQSMGRGWMFIRDAGTVILFISIAIWFLSNYPKIPEQQVQTRLAAHANGAVSAEVEANLRQQWNQEYSLLGWLGQTVEPAFRPLGFDWKTSVGVLASFAAREVIVSTLSILYGVGELDADSSLLHERLSGATRDDGSPVFDVATCSSLLVFFVLAMQCLPTQAVTKRETGSWKWAGFQFAYMSCLAYVAALVTYQMLRLFA